jgi:hypothetical protein
MTGKGLLAVSLLLPFMAISSVVQADAATAMKRHSGNEVRGHTLLKQTTVRAEVLPRPGPYHGSGVGAYYATGAATEACGYQYQGGPKSSLWTCRR